MQRLLPEVDRLWGVPQPAEHHPEIDSGRHLLLVLRQCAQLRAPLAVRFACLCHDLGKGTTPSSDWPRHIGHEARGAALARKLGERWRVPTDCRELADVTAREHGHVHASGGFGATAVARLLDRCDAWRRPERFGLLLLACECDARGRLGFERRDYPQRARLWSALQAGLGVDTTAVATEAAAHGLSGPQIGQRVAQARVQAIEAWLAPAD